MRDYKEFIRSTILKTCLNDELRAFDMIHHPEVVPAPSTPANLEMGSLIHLLLLEPESFMEKVVCADYTRRGDKKHQEVVLNHPEKIIVKQETLEVAKEVTTRALKSKKAKSLLHNCHNLYEQELIVDIDGQKHMAQPDIYNTETKTMIELKTTGLRIQYPWQWMRICNSLNYFCQLAHYKKVLEATGHPVEKVIMFVQETKYPFAYHIYNIADTLMESGEIQWEDALTVYNKLLNQKELPDQEPEMLVSTGERFGGVDIGLD